MWTLVLDSVVRSQHGNSQHPMLCFTDCHSTCSYYGLNILKVALDSVLRTRSLGACFSDSLLAEGELTPWWNRQPRIPCCHHCKVSSRVLCDWYLLLTHHPTYLGMSSKMTAEGGSLSMPLTHKLGWMFPGRANHLPTGIQVLPSYREAKLHLEHS